MIFLNFIITFVEWVITNLHLVFLNLITLQFLFNRILRLIIVGIFGILFTQQSFAQFRVKGQIIDSTNNEKLELVTILVNDGQTRLGTVSNKDGNFNLKSSIPITFLTIEYLGYHSKIVPIPKTDDGQTKELLIKLVPKEYTFSEIVIVPGENPAHRIIHSAVDNIKRNDPQELKSYFYKAQNRFIYDIEPLEGGEDYEKRKKQIQNIFSDSYAIMAESIMERAYQAPNKFSKNLIGVRTPGFKNKLFTSLMLNDFQPLSFYDEFIKISDKHFLNPISKGSTQRYLFILQDTIYHKNNKDTTFVIAFRPRKRKRFTGFKGVIHINTNKFAIERIEAKPAKEITKTSLEQQYEYNEEYNQWFLKSSNIVLSVNNFPFKGVKTNLIQKTGIDSVKINTNLDKKIFSEIKPSSFIADDVLERDSIFWVENNILEYDKEELITIHKLDSIGKTRNFSQKFYLAEKIVGFKIPITKKIDFDLDKFFVINRFEPYRLGVGFLTNENFSKKFYFGLFAGYGLPDDNRWKYGGEIFFYTNFIKKDGIGYKYQSNVRATGIPTFANLNIRLQKRYDFVDEHSINAHYLLSRNIRTAISFKTLNVIPQYDYNFVTTDRVYRSYNDSHLSFFIRWSYNEQNLYNFNKYFRIPGKHSTKYPTLQLSYIKGFKGLFGSDFNYDRLEASISYAINVKGFGKSIVRVDNGWIFNDVPYGILFTGRGNNNGSVAVFLKGNFATAFPDEFALDQYLYFFYTHDFEGRLLKIGKFQPDILFVNNAGFGSLRNKSSHRIDVKTKDRGFFETGIHFNKALRINLLNVAYVGLGAGVYYRYGYYASNNPSDNFAYLISLRIYTQ